MGSGEQSPPSPDAIKSAQSHLSGSAVRGLVVPLERRAQPA
jgi:hypothetical protein